LKFAKGLAKDPLAKCSNVTIIKKKTLWHAKFLGARRDFTNKA
jgi:hypothetical protein